MHKSIKFVKLLRIFQITVYKNSSISNNFILKNSNIQSLWLLQCEIYLRICLLLWSKTNFVSVDPECKKIHGMCSRMPRGNVRSSSLIYI